MVKIIKDNSYFFIAFLVFVIAGGIYLAVSPLEHLVLALNRHHGSVFDHLFYYITYLGTQYAYIIFVLLLLFIRFYYFFVGLIASIITGITGRVLKTMIFTDYPRPKALLKDAFDLHFLDGMEIYTRYSFPSGHAITAFTIAILVMLLARGHKVIGLLCFFIAFLVALSRVYLAQHFFRDIYAGTIIGVILTIVIYHAFNRFFHMDAHPLYRESIITIIRKKMGRKKDSEVKRKQLL